MHVFVITNANHVIGSGDGGDGSTERSLTGAAEAAGRAGEAGGRADEERDGGDAGTDVGLRGEFHAHKIPMVLYYFIY